MACPLPLCQDCPNGWICQQHPPASSQHGPVLHPNPVTAPPNCLETSASTIPGPGDGKQCSGKVSHHKNKNA